MSSLRRRSSSCSSSRLVFDRRKRKKSARWPIFPLVFVCSRDSRRDGGDEDEHQTESNARVCTAAVRSDRGCRRLVRVEASVTVILPFINARSREIAILCARSFVYSRCFLIAHQDNKQNEQKKSVDVKRALRNQTRRAAAATFFLLFARPRALVIGSYRNIANHIFSQFR